MAKELYKRTYKLTTPESEHLLWLLMQEQEDGSYSGNRERYYARRDRLIEMFTLRSDVKAACDHGIDKSIRCERCVSEGIYTYA